MLGYVMIKGSRRIHKQEGSQRKNNCNLIKETSHCHGPSVSCLKRASDLWAGRDIYDNKSEGATLQITLWTEGYCCVVLRD